MNQSILQELKAGLKSFGLNPGEWTVFWLKDSKFGVIGNSWPQLMFAGSVSQNQQSWEWKDLELLEI